MKAAQQHITTPAGLCAEILEYAKWLGMDTETEKVRSDAVTPGKGAGAACLNHGALLQELLWIARAGLKEPVPEGWKPW